MKKLIITGGCGYIGSHTAIDLIEKGYLPVSIDNHRNSSPEVIGRIRDITGVEMKNYAVDLCDLESLSRVFEAESDAVGIIHFAALKSVRESVSDPMLYYRNNVTGMIHILECAVRHEIPHFIFSSSCTVYGNPESLPVREDSPFQEAENPYGRTKQIGEYMIRDVSRRYPGINFISLRYFNPAGAHPSARIGEAPQQYAENLVPVIMEVASGKRESLTIYGSDYPTRDGTCIRDYIHIMDLADAHTLAIQYSMNHQGKGLAEVFNLGIGEGVTVQEAVDAFEAETGMKLNYVRGPRRPGDAAAVYADPGKAIRILHWRPRYKMTDIMRTAWDWERVR